MTMLYNNVIVFIHLKLGSSVCVAIIGLGMITWGIIEIMASFSVGEKMEDQADRLWRRWRRGSGEEEEEEEETAGRGSERTPLLGRSRERII